MPSRHDAQPDAKTLTSPTHEQGTFQTTTIPLTPSVLVAVSSLVHKAHASSPAADSRSDPERLYVRVLCAGALLQSKPHETSYFRSQSPAIHNAIETEAPKA